jgi:hypothetical protein
MEHGVGQVGVDSKVIALAYALKIYENQQNNALNAGLQLIM